MNWDLLVTAIAGGLATILAAFGGWQRGKQANDRKDYDQITKTYGRLIASLRHEHRSQQKQIDHLLEKVAEGIQGREECLAENKFLRDQLDVVTNRVVSLESEIVDLRNRIQT